LQQYARFAANTTYTHGMLDTPLNIASGIVTLELVSRDAMACNGETQKKVVSIVVAIFWKHVNQIHDRSFSIKQASDLP